MGLDTNRQRRRWGQNHIAALSRDDSEYGGAHVEPEPRDEARPKRAILRWHPHVIRRDAVDVAPLNEASEHPGELLPPLSSLVGVIVRDAGERHHLMASARELRIETADDMRS